MTFTFANNIYGSTKHMENSSNAIYKVTTNSGLKHTYYMFNKLTDTTKWLGKKYANKGWICVVVSEDCMEKTVSYEYPDLDLSDIENTWFKRDCGIQNYQQVKYDPYIIDKPQFNFDSDDDFDDYESDDGEQVDYVRK